MLAAFKLSVRNSWPYICAMLNAANIYRLGIIHTKRKYIYRSFETFYEILERIEIFKVEISIF